ncbi:MAG: extracellular solute-binding protein, partial [Chloroflexota bacterium]|nr:extracellular solute-binding protein [Chloroflexota bacterium]
TDHVDAICEGFEAFVQQYGANIDCEGRGIGAGQIVGTLKAEREAGEAPTDVVYMSMTQMAQYIDDGYAEAVDWGALGADERRVWDAAEGVTGNALGVSNNQYTNFYRTDIFSIEDLPKSVFEWTDPKYKDLACAPSFLFRAGNGFMAFRYDPDEMVRVQKQMIDDNGLLVTGSCNEFILSGERPLVWMGYGNPPALLDSGVIGQFWNDGMGINMFNVAVANNANNPNAAKFLAAWHSSKEASLALFESVGAGWAAYGHAAPGLTSGGDFEGVKMVFESVPVARQRGINANYFGEQVFGAN